MYSIRLGHAQLLTDHLVGGCDKHGVMLCEGVCEAEQRGEGARLFTLYCSCIVDVRCIRWQPISLVDLPLFAWGPRSRTLNSPHSTLLTIPTPLPPDPALRAAFLSPSRPLLNPASSNDGSSFPSRSASISPASALGDSGELTSHTVCDEGMLCDALTTELRRYYDIARMQERKKPRSDTHSSIYVRI